jgi:hypothetical protein
MKKDEMSLKMEHTEQRSNANKMLAGKPHDTRPLWRTRQTGR